MSKKITVKDILFIIVSLISIIIFTPLLEATIDYIIENSKINDVKNSYTLDFLIIGLVIISILIVIKLIPNKRITLLLLLIGGFYYYQRFINNHFEFLNFESLPQLVYFDVVFLIVLIYLGTYLKYFDVKKNKEGNTLEEDSPIKNRNDDELDNLFSKTVEKIKDIIDKNSFETSYTIGINSEWGNGKSTILEMVKSELKENSDKIIVDFNPWMGFDKKVLIKDFFNSLSESLTENNISNEVYQYSEELVNATDNSVLKTIKNIFYREKSLETLFNNINNKIKLLNKKIVVFVDDIDRLDNEEIFQLLKLIRNTANFQRTYFIMAYDREYVVGSINGINEYASVNYLDKIINTELTLPYFDRNILKEIFRLKLVEKIGLDYKEQIDYALDIGMDNSDLFDYENVSNNFNDWISNIREIKKLVNSIYINFNGFFDEINFTDLFYIELLKLKYPYLYKLLYSKKDSLLRERSNRLYFRELEEKSSFEEFMDEKDTSKFIEKKKAQFKETVIWNILEKYCIENNIIEIEKRKIRLLLLNLFGIYDKTGINFLTSKYDDDKLSVSYTYKFERYFSQTIFKGNISEKQFYKMLNSTEIERGKIINEWINIGKERDLLFRLLGNIEYKNRVEFENTMKSIIQLVHSNSHFNDSQKVGFDFQRFKYKIQSYEGDTKITDLYRNENEFKEFILNLFNSAVYPYIFESQTLSAINSNSFREELRFVLSTDEINNILKSYILKYLDETTVLNNSFWTLFKLCKKLSLDNGFKVFTIYDVVKEKIIDVLNDNDNVEFFIKSIIERGMDNDVGKIHIKTIEDIFDSVENFEELILIDIDDEKTPLKFEFKDFYLKVKNNNWEEIVYDFKYLKRSRESGEILTMR
ncbi:KAP family P-loop NTPase fold protein [Chryseobacterium sp. CBSDS_008]|uniref:KAP family P-loop NTPase fold protein n=1 Tax=Chryseobacterium sp. CBSDS_008 TaxID=3415265 RepID=UPI003CE96F51